MTAAKKMQYTGSADEAVAEALEASQNPTPAGETEEEFEAAAFDVEPILVAVNRESHKREFALFDGKPMKNERTLTIGDVTSMAEAIRYKGFMSDPTVSVLCKVNGELETDTKKYSNRAAIEKACTEGTHFLHELQGNRRIAAVNGGKFLDPTTNREVELPGMTPEEIQKCSLSKINSLAYVGISKELCHRIAQDHSGTLGLRRADMISSMVHRINTTPGMTLSAFALAERGHLRYFQEPGKVEATDNGLIAIDREVSRGVRSFKDGQKAKEKLALESTKNTVDIVSHIAALERFNFPQALEVYIANEMGRKAVCNLKGKKTDLSKLRNLAEAAANAGKLPMEFPEFKSYWNELKKAHKEKLAADANGSKAPRVASLPKADIESAAREFVGTPAELAFKAAAGDRDALVKLRTQKSALIDTEGLAKIIRDNWADLKTVPHGDAAAEAIVKLIQKYNADRIKGSVTTDEDGDE